MFCANHFLVAEVEVAGADRLSKIRLSLSLKSPTLTLSRRASLRSSSSVWQLRPEASKLFRSGLDLLGSTSKMHFRRLGTGTSISKRVDSAVEVDFLWCACVGCGWGGGARDLATRSIDSNIWDEYSASSSWYCSQSMLRKREAVVVIGWPSGPL